MDCSKYYQNSKWVSTNESQRAYQKGYDKLIKAFKAEAIKNAGLSNNPNADVIFEEVWDYVKRNPASGIGFLESVFEKLKQYS